MEKWRIEEEVEDKCRLRGGRKMNRTSLQVKIQPGRVTEDTCKSGEEMEESG